jgi:hypothetical protein
MTDIPEDVMKLAKAAYYEEAAKPVANFQRAIASAILAERNRWSALTAGSSALADALLQRRWEATSNTSKDGN